LDQVDYEYDFNEQKAKVVGVEDEGERFAPAFLKYSRSYGCIILGTQNGLLARI